MQRSRVGVVVRDLDSTVDFFASGLGFGPFETEEIDARRATRRGCAAPARLRRAAAPLGECEMEVLEVVAGRPPHRDFLDEQGEGLNHFCLEVKSGDEYLARMAELASRGMDYFWGYPERGFAYVKTDTVGGVTFEILRGRRGHSHVGLVAEDMKQVTGFFEATIGLGPWEVGVFPTERAVYRRERIDATFRAGFARIGECWLEVLQVLDGDTPHGERLARRGEGLAYVALEVDDLDAQCARLSAAGIEEVWRSPEAGRVAFDTTAIGGTTFEYAQAGSLAR